MGNENIYMLTSNDEYMLRIELEDFEGNRRYGGISYSVLSVYAKVPKLISLSAHSEKRKKSHRPPVPEFQLNHVISIKTNATTYLFIFGCIF